MVRRTKHPFRHRLLLRSIRARPSVAAGPGFRPDEEYDESAGLRSCPSALVDCAGIVASEAAGKQEGASGLEGGAGAGGKRAAAEESRGLAQEIIFPRANKAADQPSHRRGLFFWCDRVEFAPISVTGIRRAEAVEGRRVLVSSPEKVPTCGADTLNTTRNRPQD